MKNKKLKSTYIQQYEYPHFFDENGFEMTKNCMGAMHSLTSTSADFIRYAISQDEPVLDVGCAYGVATLPIAEHKKSVYAVDCAAEHIEILKARLPGKYAHLVTPKVAKFPEETNYEDGFFSAVLLSLVTSFLTKEGVLEGFQKIHNWLIPNGRLYIVSYSPYTSTRTQFISTYEKKLKEGDMWAGYLDNMERFSASSNYKKVLPNQLNLFTPITLSYFLKRNDFTIKYCNYIQEPEIPLPNDIRYDGRELVGCCAIKT